MVACRRLLSTMNCGIMGPLMRTRLGCRVLTRPLHDRTAEYGFSTSWLLCELT